MLPFSTNKLLGDAIGFLGERLFRTARMRDPEARDAVVQTTASLRVNTSIAGPAVAIDLIRDEE